MLHIEHTDQLMANTYQGLVNGWCCGENKYTYLYDGTHTKLLRIKYDSTVSAFLFCYTDRSGVRIFRSWVPEF